MTATLSELAGLAAAVVAAGLVAGLLAGLFGIGGGAVLVPALFEAFRLFGVPQEVRMQLCVGTSLAIIVPTAVASYRTHRAEGAALPEVVRLWAVPTVLGVATGAVAAAYLPGGALEAAFVVVALLIAARFLAGSETWVIGDALPGAPAMTGYGYLIGLFSALMGISGGSLATLVLTLYGRRIHTAVATAAGVGVPITVAGTVGYVLAGFAHQARLPPLSLGFVSLVGVVLIAPISSYIAPVGARLAHRAPKRWLEIGFAGFLLLAAARFAANLFSHAPI